MVLDSLERYRVGIHGIPAALAERGLALVEGLTDSSDLLRLAESIGSVVPHRDSGADGVTTIADLGAECVQSGFAGFSVCALNPHTDRSGVDHPPALLMTSCGQPADTGGECVLIDGRAVYDDLAESEPDALRAFCAPRSVLFGGAAGYLGSIFTCAEDGRIAVRLRLDDLAQFSPEVSRWLPTLRAVIDRHALMVNLDIGQGYVLNNHRWLHGRRAFTGQRVIFRVNATLGDSVRLPANSSSSVERDAVTCNVRSGEECKTVGQSADGGGWRARDRSIPTRPEALSGDLGRWSGR